MYIEGAKKNSIMVIRTIAYKDERTFDPFDMIEDFAFPGRQKDLKLEIDYGRYPVDFRFHDLIFSLLPFSGNPDIFVNPGSRPDKIADYKWNSTELDEERIVLSPTDR